MCVAKKMNMDMNYATYAIFVHEFQCLIQMQHTDLRLNTRQITLKDSTQNILYTVNALGGRFVLSLQDLPLTDPPGALIET